MYGMRKTGLSVVGVIVKDALTGRIKGEVNEPDGVYFRGIL